MYKLILCLIISISLNATEKMTLKELAQGVYSETKEKVIKAKKYVKNTYEKNKLENKETAILETSKEVSKTALNKTMDLTIDAAKEVKQHLKD